MMRLPHQHIEEKGLLVKNQYRVAYHALYENNMRSEIVLWGDSFACNIRLRE